MNSKRWLIPLTVLFMAQSSHAQGDGTPIMDQTPEGIRKANDALIEKFRPLIDAKKLLTRDKVKEGHTEPATINLSAVKGEPLSGEEIAMTARTGNLRVGYCYLCANCDQWHVNLAGGYPIAPDVVATCEHVINNSIDMREGYLVVADQDDNVYPVSAVIAKSSAMDAALLRVEGANFKPLALNVNVKQGASAYCYSTPLGQIGYFSEGIVNRFLWDMHYKGGDKDTVEGAPFLRVNFSTDWAPGSSGSAVLDESGNVIGHVSRIAGLSEEKDGQPLITVHTGIPARAVSILAEAAGDAEKMKRLAEVDAEVAKMQHAHEAHHGHGGEGSKAPEAPKESEEAKAPEAPKESEGVKGDAEK